MAAADTAKLIASLELKDAFSKPLKGASRALAGFDAKLSQTEGRAFKAGQQIGTGIKNGARIAAVGLGLLATQVIVGLRQLADLEDQTAATQAALKSTGGIAGQTASSIRGLAEKYENLNAVIDDKVIQSGENVLLTFTRIRGEAFEPALAAALDLSVAMGQDLQQSIVQVGKALNDPAKGFTALRRVGIQFTADQEDQIKTLQASGDLLGAQKVILQELGTEFGGRFAAQGRTAKGTIAGIGDAVEDLQKGLASAVFPTVQKWLPRLRETLGSPQFAATVSKIGDSIAGIFNDQNIAEGGRVLDGLFKTAQAAAPIIQQAAEVTGQVIQTAVGVFKSLPPELQALAVAGLAINKLTGGLVTNIAGGLISAVISSFKGLMNVNAAVVNVNGAVGGGGLPGGLPAAAGAAAGGAALPVAAGVAGVAAAAIAIPAIGLALKQINDPNRIKELTGLAATATARGIPDANNKPLQELRRIQASLKESTVTQDRSMDTIERLRSAVMSGTNATEANTSAVKTSALTRTELQAIFAASGAARGVVNKPGASTSLKGRLDFLRGNASGAKDAAVSRSLATVFTQSNAPLYRNTANLVTTIKALKADQRQLLKAGDTKNAALIGGDIDRLKGELARRQAATTKAVRDKDLTVTTNVSVPVSVKQFINGRLIEAATGRFTSTIVGSKGTFREFG